MKKVLYAKLPTEQQNPRSKNIDRISIDKIIQVINQEDEIVPKAVGKVRGSIAKAVKLIIHSLKNGGKLYFVGAGTSGRLGVLEAAECPPTFNTPPSMIQAVIAGGKKAVFRSVEGAEDKKASIAATRKDVVVGIAASGITPFVLNALRDAKSKKAKTILIACNVSSPAKNSIDCLIAPQVGPEVITGSTRLKAGTATKLVLNTLTVTSMIQLGKVYENWMVDLQPKNNKLTARATRLIERIGAVSSNQAIDYLKKANRNVKVAILMARNGWDSKTASSKLKQNAGFLRNLLS